MTPRASTSHLFAYTGEQVEISTHVLLADLHPEDWEQLRSFTHPIRFRQGDYLVERGHHDRSLYLVFSGSFAKIDDTSAAHRTHRSHEAPTLFGELEFVADLPHLTTLQALTDGEMARLSFESFQQLSAMNPVLGRTLLLDVAQVIAGRVTHLTERLEELETARHSGIFKRRALRP